MSNINQNVVDYVVPAVSMDSYFSAIANARNMVPGSGSITITDADRGGYLSMDVDNRILTENVISELERAGGSIVPAFISAQKISNDFTLVGQLDKMASAAQDLLNAIADVRRIAAHEAVGAANVVYGIYQVAAKAGIPGAKEGYDRLSERYKSNGGSAATGAPTTSMDA